MSASGGAVGSQKEGYHSVAHTRAPHHLANLYARTPGWRPIYALVHALPQDGAVRVVQSLLEELQVTVGSALVQDSSTAAPSKEEQQPTAGSSSSRAETPAPDIQPPSPSPAPPANPFDQHSRPSVASPSERQREKMPASRSRESSIFSESDLSYCSDWSSDKPFHSDVEDEPIEFFVDDERGASTDEGCDGNSTDEDAPASGSAPGPSNLKRPGSPLESPASSSRAKRSRRSTSAQGSAQASNLTRGDEEMARLMHELERCLKAEDVGHRLSKAEMLQVAPAAGLRADIYEYLADRDYSFACAERVVCGVLYDVLLLQVPLAAASESLGLNLSGEESG